MHCAEQQLELLRTVSLRRIPLDERGFSVTHTQPPPICHSFSVRLVISGVVARRAHERGRADFICPGELVNVSFALSFKLPSALHSQP